MPEGVRECLCMSVGMFLCVCGLIILTVRNSGETAISKLFGQVHTGYWKKNLIRVELDVFPLLTSR